MADEYEFSWLELAADCIVSEVLVRSVMFHLFLRCDLADQIYVSSQCKSTLFEYLHLRVETHRYVHCSLDVVVDTVDQFELVVAVCNPTKLRRSQQSFARRLQLTH